MSAPVHEPRPFDAVTLPTEGILSPAELGVRGEPRPGAQQGGEREAHRILDSFLHDRGRHYRKEMSSPRTAWDSCSRLSPHLAYGTISTRQVAHALRKRREELRAMRKAPPGWLASLASFDARLHWRCHFMQKLEDEPRLEFENMARAYDGLR
ncbi:MAG: deoxyribodipyrimidine photolyase, partial [Planctomycetota bacterium]